VSHAPLQSLAQLATGGNLNEEDGTNDRIFVYSGTYTSGIDLESGQKLLGQPEGLLDGATQLVAAGGTAPAISASTLNAHVVALSTGNELQDLALGSTSGSGASLSGGSIGTATVGNTSINNTAGRAIEITTGGTLNAGFDSVSSSNSSGVGVGLTGLSGTIGLGTGTIQNASGTDFHVSGGAANVTYNGAINDTDGRLVNIDGTTGGSRTFNGAVADITDNDNGSTGVRINSAAGPNSFAGGLKLSTGTADALEINSSTGTTTVPNSTVNTLKSTAGYALRAASSPVNLTFQRIDSSGSGTKSGINLSSVSGGGLTVTGAGSAGTGGTISNKQEAGNDADFFSVDGDDADGGNGIHLTNVTAPVSFSRMQLNDFGGFAVRAHGHSGGFSMIDSTISGTNGNADAVNESSVAFTQLSGAADLTRTNVSGGHEDNIAVYNTSGTVNRFKVSGPATIGANSTTFGNGSVDMFITGGIFNATVENMAMTSTGSFHVGYNLSGTSAGDLVMTGNTLTNSHTNIAAGGGGSTIVAQGSADITYNIANNVIKGAKGAALGVSKADGGFGYNATASGSITGNTIGQAGVVNSSSTQGSGIRVGMSTLGTHTTSIRNNSVYGYANHGIQLEVGGVGTGVTGLGVHDGDLNATVKGNVINTPSLPAGGLAQNGIHVNSGSNGTPDANDAYDLCLDIGGASATDKNNITGSGALGGTEIRVRQRFAADILMPGYLGALADTTAVRNYLEPRQTMTAGSSTANHQGISATNGFGNAGAGCPQP
jgi:hypothetical protein